MTRVTPKIGHVAGCLCGSSPSTLFCHKCHYVAEFLTSERLLGGGAVASMTTLAREGVFRDSTEAHQAAADSQKEEPNKPLKPDSYQTSKGHIKTPLGKETGADAEPSNAADDPFAQPVELLGGIEIQVKSKGRWYTGTVESINPQEESLVVSFRYQSDQTEWKRKKIVLRQGRACAVRSAKQGPLCLGGIIYSRSRGSTNASEASSEKHVQPKRGESMMNGSKNTKINNPAQPEKNVAEALYYSNARKTDHQNQHRTPKPPSVTRGGQVMSPVVPVLTLTPTLNRSFTFGSEQSSHSAPKGSQNDLSPTTSRESRQYHNYWGTWEEHATGYQEEVAPWYRGWTQQFFSQLVGGQHGLANLGNTCFMNSVLQCLLHCGPLAQAALETCAKTQAASSSQQLVTAFVQLLQRQWYSQGTTSAFRPLLVKNIMGKVAPQFAGNAQHDAHEFLVFLLDAMHEELNGVRIKRYQEIKDDDVECEQERSKLWWDNYADSNVSILRDLFVGQIRSTVTCNRCGHISSTFDPFWSLNVPVPSNSSATLEECFALFSKPESLSGNNCYHCAKCQRETNGTKELAVFRCPDVLVVHLKRFSRTSLSSSLRSNTVGFSKVTSAVSMTSDAFDLSPYCAESAKNAHNGALYDLVGLVNHLGNSGQHGHYTADCFDPVSNSWFNYDDARVTPMLRIDQESVYILFYVRRRQEHVD